MTVKPTTPAAESNTEDAVTAGHRVLALERDALDALADSLDERFDAAVARLVACTGRVIVSGMGKSGHIGSKIAATLASTGTPAHFVHPAEASHGDLGMIAKDDVILALSNSGATQELFDMSAYARLVGAPLIAIVGRDPSELGRAASIKLVLPSVPEACPLGLAPTTSSTMMLALGDALAVACMNRRGFTSDDFHVLHPGGRLGRRFVKVEDIMHDGAAMPLIEAGAPMSEAILTMTEKSFGCVGVLENGRLAGIITDGDLRRHMGDDLLNQPVDLVMTPNPKTIRPKALAAEAIGFLNAAKVTCLFVTTDERPVGILHIHDILHAGIA